jgi:predicted RNase H-like HicB family nuclease
MSLITVNSPPSNNKIAEISFQTPKVETSPLKKSYSIILETDEDGRIVVRSPDSDLQGVVTDGVNKDEALKNAIESINAVLETRGLDKEYNLIVRQKPSV